MSKYEIDETKSTDLFNADNWSVDEALEKNTKMLSAEVKQTEIGNKPVSISKGIATSNTKNEYLKPILKDIFGNVVVFAIAFLIVRFMRAGNSYMHDYTRIYCCDNKCGLLYADLTMLLLIGVCIIAVVVMIKKKNTVVSRVMELLSVFCAVNLYAFRNEFVENLVGYDRFSESFIYGEFIRIMLYVVIFAAIALIMGIKRFKSKTYYVFYRIFSILSASFVIVGMHYNYYLEFFAIILFLILTIISALDCKRIGEKNERK